MNENLKNAHSALLLCDEDFINKNCYKIAEEISMSLGESVTVVSAYRSKSKVPNKSGKIVAVLNSYKNQKNLMELSRKKRFKANNVNVKWNDEDIY